MAGLNPAYIEQVPYWIFLYDNGMGHKKIATKCGVPKSAVYTYLKQFRMIDPLNMSKSKKGALNPMWAGDTVSITALHAWVRRNLPQPALCDECKVRPSIDLANVSHVYNPETYNRNFSNWEWLCRRCHMDKDGRINNLKQYNAANQM